MLPNIILKSILNQHYTCLKHGALFLPHIYLL
jgi:hypothetical protein